MVTTVFAGWRSDKACMAPAEAEGPGVRVEKFGDSKDVACQWAGVYDQGGIKVALCGAKARRNQSN